jgi:hypothetical protein
MLTPIALFCTAGLIFNLNVPNTQLNKIKFHPNMYDMSSQNAIMFLSFSPISPHTKRKQPSSILPISPVASIQPTQRGLFTISNFPFCSHRRAIDRPTQRPRPSICRRKPQFGEKAKSMAIVARRCPM